MKNNIIFLLKNIFGLNGYLKFIAFKNKFEAIAGKLSNRDSYSQYGEDRLIYNLLKRANVENAIYVEIGANHPIKISNTYLLYKNGMRGIVVEPNNDLLKLFEIVRPEDVRLNIGIGPYSCVQDFLMTDAHARNSFGKNTDYMKEKSINICKTIKIPVLALDDVMKNFSSEISFLSIDTEGMEMEILSGAIKTLEKTYLLCVEAGSPEDRQAILSALADRFGFVADYGCNLIMYNKKLLMKTDVDATLGVG